MPPCKMKSRPSQLHGKVRSHAFEQRMYRLRRIARLGIATVRKEEYERLKRYRDKRKAKARP